ncbi:MAG: T9SS type A sorting domain-containing protein [Bacteroidia bacterium]
MLFQYSLGCFSQLFDISKDSVYHEAPDIEYVFYSPVEIINEQDSALHIHWRIASRNIPSGWGITETIGQEWIQDSIQEGWVLVPPTVDESSKLITQFYPNLIAGYGEQLIELYAASDTSFKVYCLFRGRALKTSSLNSLSALHTVYPNPATGWIFLKTEEKYSTVEIVDLQGKTRLKIERPLNDGICIESLEQGLYIVRLNEENGKFSSLRLVVLN